MGVLVLLIAVVLPAFFAWTLRRSAKAAFAHARLDRGASAVLAAFGLLFAAVGGTKTNSPPARLLHRMASAVQAAFTSPGFPYGRETWPFDAATGGAVADMPSTAVWPIPDEMSATGVALYRVNPDVALPDLPRDRHVLGAWTRHDIDNRGLDMPLPFAFPFNGACHTNVGVLSNGRLAFGHATLHRRPAAGLPLPGGLEIAAPFWGDHLLVAESGSAVSAIAGEDEMTVVWENLVTPGAASNTTVVCRLERSGRMSWYYSPVATAALPNVTAGIQSGTNGWSLAPLFASGAAVELVPVGGPDWAAADDDGDGLANYEEFMLGTDPRKADTDGDGPDDKWELAHGFPPDLPALPPVLADSDGDGVADKWEAALGTATNAVTTGWPCADSDGDGFVDYYETRHLGTDPADWGDPAGTNTYGEAVLACEIDSSLPCLLVVASSNAVVEIPWIPGVSPAVQKVYVPGGGNVAVRLARDFADAAAPPDGLGGYWYATLVLRDTTSGEEASRQGGAFGPFHARPAGRQGPGWIAPGNPVSNEWELEYWRLKFADGVIDFCGGLAEAWLWLDPSSDCGGAPHWHSVPAGIEGTGNPLLFSPSELAPGTYEVYATTADDSPHVRASATVNIRRLVLADGHEVVNVDAADTTPHAITLDEGSYSPDGYTVTSEPAGIDDLTFVPADLDPGVAYHVRIFNGLCGSADVTVNNLALVSETEAEWPADRTRTDIGVGEVVRLSIAPSSIAIEGASCDNSHYAAITSTTTEATLTAFDIQHQVTATVIAGGITLCKSFSIWEPASIAYAFPWYPEPIGRFIPGAACSVDVVIAPTNVAFNNVFMTEGYCEATNYCGWFNDCESRHPPHGIEQGADIVISPRYDPAYDGTHFTDKIAFVDPGMPWSFGMMEWRMPVSWWIDKHTGETNKHNFVDNSWIEEFELDENGTVTIRKFGASITRSLSGDVILKDSKGVVQ